MYHSNTTEVILCPSQGSLLGMWDGGGDGFFHLVKAVPASLPHYKFRCFPFVISVCLVRSTVSYSVAHYTLITILSSS